MRAALPSSLRPAHPAPALAPRSGHVFHNRGIGGSSSGIYAVCAEYMVDPVSLGSDTLSPCMPSRPRKAGRASASTLRHAAALVALQPQQARFRCIVLQPIAAAFVHAGCRPGSARIYPKRSS